MPGASCLNLGLAVVVAMPGSAISAPPSAPPENSEQLRQMPLGSFVDFTSLEQLANLVVTDTKVAQSADTVTQSITVLRAEDFDRQPGNYGNIADLMRYTSGQFVNVLSRNDANWGSYGGLGPKYNTYLLDGLPIDSFVDAMSLDPWAFERVEAYKGPAAVMYSNYLSMDFVGNESPLAGTTNFILKDRIEAPMTRVQIGAGSYNTVNGRAYHQGRSGNLSYLFGAGLERSDYTQYGNQDSWLQTVDKPGYEKSRVYGKLSYAFDRVDHTLSLFMHHTGHDGDMGRPNRDFEHRYDTVNMSYSNQLNDVLHVQAKLGERRYDREFANDNYPTSLTLISRDSTRQTIRPMDLTFSYLQGKNALLTVGADAQWVDYETESRSPSGVVTPGNKAQANSIGYFAQEKIQWQNWVFRAGVRHNTIRHDYELLSGNTPTVDSASWSKNLWSVGLRYNMSPSLAFYGNAGSSFMAPAAKQIGGTVNVPSASGELANPSLKPESGIGRDFGVDWQATRSLKMGLRVFLNTISDAIVTNVVSTAPSQTRSENAGSAQSSGLEWDVRYTPSAELSWFANLTRTRTKVENPITADQDGTEIPFTPDTMANFGLTAHLPWQLTLSPYLQWVGRYWDSTSRTDRHAFGNYGVANLRLQKNARQDATSSVDLFVDLNNIGNRRYEMPFDFRAPGFNAFAGLNVVF